MSAKDFHTPDRFSYERTTMYSFDTKHDEQVKWYSKEELRYYTQVLNDILGPDAMSENGVLFEDSYAFCQMDPEKHFNFSMVPFKEKKIMAKQIMDAVANGDRNHQYIGANSYKKRTTVRDEDHVFALRNIVIDIDNHDADTTDELYLYHTVNKANAVLNYVRKTKEFPAPNLLVLTGRGVQVWYFLEPASKKLSFVYNSIAEELRKKYENIAKEQGFSVDISASSGMNRLYRIPGTYNSAGHIYSQCVRIAKERRTIPQLQEILSIQFESRETISDKKNGKRSDFSNAVFGAGKEEKRNDFKNNKKPKRRNDFSDNNSISIHQAWLMRRRCQIIEEVVHSGRPVQSRETLLFLYHNFAMFIPEVDEEEAVFQLNQCFMEPIKTREIHALIKCNQKKEGYYYTDEKFFEKAWLTTEEIQTYCALQRGTVSYGNKNRENLFIDCGQALNETATSKKNTKDKNRARDTRRKTKKEKTITAVQEMYRYGRAKKYAYMKPMSIREIAEKAGCCVNTVKKYIEPIRQGLERELLYRQLCEQIKQLRKAKKEEKEKFLETELHKNRGAYWNYIIIRLQHEALCYAYNVMMTRKKSNRPKRKEMEDLWNAVEIILNGKKDVFPLLRAGFAIDKYHQVIFKSRDKAVINKLKKGFPESCTRCIVWEEGYRAKEQRLEKLRIASKEKQEKSEEMRVKKQEEMASIFLKKCEMLEKERQLKELSAG